MFWSNCRLKRSGFLTRFQGPYKGNIGQEWVKRHLFLVNWFFRDGIERINVVSLWRFVRVLYWKLSFLKCSFGATSSEKNTISNGQILVCNKNSKAITIMSCNCSIVSWLLFSYKRKPNMSWLYLNIFSSQLCHHSKLKFSFAHKKK